MTATRRTRGGVDAELVGVWAAVGTVVIGGGSVTAAVHLANQRSDTPADLPANPFDLLFGLLGGTIGWPAQATEFLIGLTGLVLLCTGGLWIVAGRRRGGRVDRAATTMGRGHDLQALSLAQATRTARRLGVTTDTPGLPIGRTVAGGQTLYAGWEDVTVDIWGPRTGKTTARAIPAILAAPGPVVATSNKRDLVDATRGPRQAAGPVWVFDPQGIVDEPASWWWNPLSYVTDEVKATMLADIFAAASRDPGARTDAFFDPAARELLAGLLLAAACDQRPVTQTYLWLTDPADDDPVLILREHGYTLTAASVAGVINAPDKQRGGIYGTAQQIAAFLTNRQATRWVTPPTPAAAPPANPWVTTRPASEFSPAAFIADGGTLYSLSKEGQGSAGPLVTALTVAVTEAAEQQARRSPGGRLAVPLVAVLDEAANVCRWRELPNLYSHYGSRGICVLTILQSWSQGVEVWGREGMRKLWSAATIKVYGGGVSEAEFLGELAQLIGDYDAPSVSISYSRQGRQRSHATKRERILDVADLAALPRGRAVVFASGMPPTLIHTIPWMDSPAAAAIRASITAHQPTDGGPAVARPVRSLP